MSEYFTVSELTAYLTNIITRDQLLNNFWIKGEMSGFKLYQQSGHMYFTLKDEEASVSGVMFKSRARYLKFDPKDGMEVLVRGYLSIFARQGRYQMYVEEMLPYGAGALYLFMEQLKEKLEKAGCFALERKQPIPAMVNCVGVVTSQAGAALRDILRVLQLRHRGVEVIIAHAAVQGDDAPAEIAEGIRLLNELGQVELIIVGRGGGSFEDLMAFSSEVVVQAIYDSKIPIISAVGHEVDFTLADMAADVRAATPTQAAQMAVADMMHLEKQVTRLQAAMARMMTRKIELHNEWLDKLMLKKVWQHPSVMLEKQHRDLQELKRRLADIIQNIGADKANRLALLTTALDQLSPLKIMQRGFGIVQKDNQVVRSGQEIVAGDQLQILLWDTSLQVEVQGKERVSR